MPFPGGLLSLRGETQMQKTEINLVEFKSGWGAYNGFSLEIWQDEGHTYIGMAPEACRRLAHAPILENMELGCVGDHVKLAFNFATYDESEWPVIKFNHDTQPSELAAQLRSYADRLEVTSADIPSASEKDAKYHRQLADAAASAAAESAPETSADS